MSESGDSPYRLARAWLAERPDFESASPDRQRATSFPLERPAALLERLGRPDRAARIVLIAGTKGKGSTAVLAAGILQAHGRQVGLYSQPHLHTYRERMRIDGELIGEAEFAEAVERIKPVVAKLDAARSELGPLTAYEITTMLALDWFARRGVDWMVLEVGLGGRLDATNVVTPDLAVITSISYDHTHILGKTLGAIAAEKAGIIKPGGVVVSAPQRPAAARVIAAACRERGARLAADGQERLASFRAERIVAHQITAGEPAQAGETFFDLDLVEERLGACRVQLYFGGAHQITNLLTALETLRAAGIELQGEAVQGGVAAARWPGRLEPIRAGRLVVLDGAHNGDSATRLSEALRLHFRYERLIIVLGVMADKDLRAILRPLAGLGSLIAVGADSPRARPAGEVARAARRLGMEAEEDADVAAGVRHALDRAGEQDLVVVTGSLAVVAEGREALGVTSE